MKDYTIKNSIEQETKFVHDFKKLLDSSESVSADLEELIQVRYIDKDLDIDEKDPYVQLYRLLANVNYFTDKHSDIINPYAYLETKSTLKVLEEEIEVAESVEETTLLKSLKLVRDHIKDVR